MNLEGDKLTPLQLEILEKKIEELMLNYNQRDNVTPGENNNNFGVGGDTSTVPTENHSEQLNPMSEALSRQDLGGTQINQDSDWDVDSTPEPGLKVDPASIPESWGQPTMRNRIKVVPLPPNTDSSIPESWGQPNKSDTWGDDGNEAENLWTGDAADSGNNIAGSAGTADNWGDHKKMRSGGNPMDLREVPSELGPIGRTALGQAKMSIGAASGCGSTTSQWDNASEVAGPKDLSAMNKPSGWGEPSPSFDNGTSLWNQQHAQQTQQSQQKRSGLTHAEVLIRFHNIMMASLGVKKEDCDLALRATNFNIEDATEMLVKASMDACIRAIDLSRSSK